MRLYLAVENNTPISTSESFNGNYKNNKKLWVLRSFCITISQSRCNYFSYPIWVREQGVGRNLSAPLANIMNTGSKWSGGDYHTTYWPMASFLSSKKYHFELHMPTYSGDLGFLKPIKKRFAQRSAGTNVDWFRI